MGLCPVRPKTMQLIFLHFLFSTESAQTDLSSRDNFADTGVREHF